MTAPQQTGRAGPAFFDDPRRLGIASVLVGTLAFVTGIAYTVWVGFKFFDDLTVDEFTLWTAISIAFVGALGLVGLVFGIRAQGRTRPPSRMGTIGTVLSGLAIGLPLLISMNVWILSKA